VDDVVQETLCDAIASGRAPGSPEDFRRWVLAIARFKVVDAHRASVRERASESVEVASPPPPVEAMGLLRWAERQLPRSDGTSTLRWMLREAEGDKLESIAADEALPAERVRQRVSRLRRWMRGRWLAEMALIAAVAVVSAGALSRRQEVILPDLAGSSAPLDVPVDERLHGIYRLLRFTPATPLPAARQALVNRLAPALVATFDGRTVRATAADFDRTMTVDARSGEFHAVDATHAMRLSGSYAWEGDDLVVRIATGPWAGVARFQRAH
jgi:hypothetical protein